MLERIYLDNNATTPVADEVIDAMQESMRQNWGNPSSIHYYGQEARAVLCHARRAVAKALGCRPSELTFSSGGTEGLNCLIRGIMHRVSGGHIITTDVEHAAVYNVVRGLEEEGHSATYLNVGEYGSATRESVEAAIQENTRLIVLMAVNNETGAKTDIEGIAQLAEERGIAFVVDGVAYFGKEIFTIPSGVSALVFSGHKFHAPKGVGGFFLRKGTPYTPMIAGGGQESQRRGGTENLHGIVGLAKAVDLLSKESEERMLELRDLFEELLQKELDDVVINATGPRVCNTSNLAFMGVDGESLLMSLDLEGLCASHGSACSAGALEPSRVLVNMGLSRERAASSVRFSLSRYTTKEEVERAVEIIVRVVKRLRTCHGSSI